MIKHKIEIFSEAGYIRKYYNNVGELNRELEIYRKDWDFLPALRNTGRDFLDIEYKSSMILWDMSEIDFYEIGKLYGKLHNAETKEGKVICHIDCNPRNVLYCPDEQKYYLIDFVDWRWEMAEYDVIHFLLFWAAALNESDYYKLTGKFYSGWKSIHKTSITDWDFSYQRAVKYFIERRKSYGKKEQNNGGDEMINRERIKSLAGKCERVKERGGEGVKM